jgi:hypothetical protein
MTVHSYDQFYKPINYDRTVCSALASVVNYDRKCDTHQSLESSFTIVMCS